VHLDPGSFEFPSNCDCHLVFMPFCLKMEKKKKMGNCIFFLMLCAPGLGSPAGGGACMYTTRNVSDGFMKWS
jgi:hypothetical protein